MTMAHAFVKLLKDAPYEKAFLYDSNGKKFRQVLWGDWLTLAEDADVPAGKARTADWQWVRWAWRDETKRRLLKIKPHFVDQSRPLEIVFVDVGIGDGAVLITPERGIDGTDPMGQERVIVIDAGKTGHMRRFLDERFKAYRDGFDFHAAVITHPDADHYYGFNRILASAEITFDHLYHNGMVELNSAEDMSRVGGTELGPDGTPYVTTIVADNQAMRDLFDPAHNQRTNWYASVIGKGITKKNVSEFRMLGVNIGAPEAGKFWMPGFAPSDGRRYTIEVLGPWVEYPFGPGKPSLRVFDNDLSLTKNGHSVLLRLVFGKFSVLFGGDLNRASEMFLLQQYAGLSAWPHDDAGRDAMVKEAAKRLRSDVMKACHHGASDVTDEFLLAVNPAAFVISSGDEDANYVHPRPDLLGRLGKFGRGAAPVLLSTELQRSTRDIDNRDLVATLTKQIADLADCDAAAHGAPTFENDRAKALKTLLAKFGALALPSVAVDGAIYVKTDGERLITAFKKETQDAKDKWFYYAYRFDDAGALRLVPRDDSHSG
jgi:hypothetical protein